MTVTFVVDYGMQNTCVQVATVDACSLNASLFGGVVIPLVTATPLSPKEGNSFNGVCLCSYCW